MTKITIFTDGSSKGNPGPGGWGAIIIEKLKINRRRHHLRHHLRQGHGGQEGYGGQENQNLDATVTELGGREEATTNNRMELTAVAEGLSSNKEKSSITIYTDSSYVINGITKWITNWKKHNWRKYDWKTKTATEEVLNRDLWEKLDKIVATKKIEWKYVGGHIGIVGNERCDHIATDFADGNKVKLFRGPLSDYDLPNILDLSHDLSKMSGRKSEQNRARAKAYSYVSLVDGVIETHHSWADCEKRVKGAKGARYKKSLSPQDEERIIEEFGIV